MFWFRRYMYLFYNFFGLITRRNSEFEMFFDFRLAKFLTEKSMAENTFYKGFFSIGKECIV